MPTIYLTLEQILIIHEDQIDNYGGSHGIRDLALLESAAYRPQTTFSNKELYPEIFDKAASLLHSLVMNHPFIDGNKRTGITAMIIFLNLNGFKFRVSQKDLVGTVMSIENKNMTIEQITQWIKSNSQRS